MQEMDVFERLKSGSFTSRDFEEILGGLVSPNETLREMTADHLGTFLHKTQRHLWYHDGRPTDLYVRLEAAFRASYRDFPAPSNNRDYALIKLLQECCFVHKKEPTDAVLQQLQGLQRLVRETRLPARSVIAQKISRNTFGNVPFQAASAPPPSGIYGLCWGCNEFKYGIKTCSRCSHAAYCSKECQTADWKNRHRPWCKERSGQP